MRDIPKSGDAVIHATGAASGFVLAGINLAALTGGTPTLFSVIIAAALLVAGLVLGLDNLRHLDRELREVNE